MKIKSLFKKVLKIMLFPVVLFLTLAFLSVAFQPPNLETFIVAFIFTSLALVILYFLLPSKYKFINKKKLPTREDKSEKHVPVSTGVSRQPTPNNYSTSIRTKVEVDYEKINYLPSDVTILDFETTGLSPDRDEIIQVGAIKYKDSEIVETFESLVKPTKPISNKIANLTGITNEMLKTAPSIEVVLGELHFFIKEEVLVAHNASFDLRFLIEHSQKNQIEHERFKVIDTLSLARNHIKRTKNHKLETLKKYLNLEAQSHNALEDCRVTGALYFHCKQLVDSQPGYHNGRHFTEYVEDIKNLKRQGLNTEAIKLLLILVDEVESESLYKNQSPAPWYYEQLAILYRKEKMKNEEVLILERYFDFCQTTSIPIGAKHPKLVERYEKLIP